MMRESITTRVILSGRMLPFHGSVMLQSVLESVYLEGSLVSVTWSVSVELEKLQEMPGALAKVPLFAACVVMLEAVLSVIELTLF